MTVWWQRHRLATVLGLEIAAVALTLIGAALLAALWPGLPGYSVTGPSQSLVLVILLALAVLAVIGGMRWWRLAGFTPAWSCNCSSVGTLAAITPGTDLWAGHEWDERFPCRDSNYSGAGVTRPTDRPAQRRPGRGGVADPATTRGAAPAVMVSLAVLMVVWLLGSDGSRAGSGAVSGDMAGTGTPWRGCKRDGPLLQRFVRRPRRGASLARMTATHGSGPVMISRARPNPHARSSSAPPKAARPDGSPSAGPNTAAGSAVVHRPPAQQL